MDIKVNAAGWNGLSGQEQDKMKAIISGIFKEQHTIVPDATVSAQSVSLAFANPFCTAACGVAEAAAVAACAALSGPAIPICIAAAHAAGDFCRSRC